MLSPDHYYPEEDFDVDYGLDLDQFEYSHPSQPRNQEPFDDFKSAPYDDDGDHHGHYRGGYYDSEPPHDTEYNDNIIMKTRPDYNEIPGRPFEPRKYYGEDRYGAMDRRSVSHPRQPQPRHHHEPRMWKDPHYSSGGHDVYSKNHRHDTYGNRDHEDNYSRRDHDFYSSARYKRPSSSYMEKAPQSTRSYRSPARAASRKKISGGSRSQRSANRERVRNFPAPDSKLPPIPPPDYEGADVGVKYVPQPDY